MRTVFMAIRLFPRFANRWALLLCLALPASAEAEPPLDPPVAMEHSPGESVPLVSVIPFPLESAPPESAALTLEPPTDAIRSEALADEGRWSPALFPLEFLSHVSPALPPYPVELNSHVQRFLDLFQSEEKREVVERWLYKSGRYLAMIREVFRQKGLPEELAFTAMIESGFNPVAVSRAGARGLWQFMEPTARRYGLRIDRWVDERLDPVKSTMAAADYLKDLFALFGSWFLAQAAYNAGEVKVARAVERSGSEDFWTIARGRLLKEETKRFVPAIQAATLIAREPVRYGFEVIPALPEPFELVLIPFSLELSVVAKVSEIFSGVLRALNPELLRNATPPGGHYSLRVPLGSGERLREWLKQLSPSDGVRWAIHRVRKGQNLQDVARIHRTTPHRLREINGLSASTLRPGTELVVPVPPPASAVPRQSESIMEPDGSVHVVKQGETLSGIAQRHGVPLEAILRWNGLTETTRIYPGNRLKVADSSVPEAGTPR